MIPKVLIDPHEFLAPVQECLVREHGCRFETLSTMLNKYRSSLSNRVQKPQVRFKFNDDFKARFPKWLQQQLPHIEGIIDQSAEQQVKQYGPWIQIMDNCMREESFSLILLWNDVTFWTKALTFLGRRYEVPTLHIAHGIPGQVPVHGKIWADKMAVFGNSSKRHYINNGNHSEKIVVTGNPRWDQFQPCALDGIPKKKQRKGLSLHKKIIVFAPTWYNNFGNGTDPKQSLIRDLTIVLEGLENLVTMSSIELVIKLHPGQKDNWEIYDQLLSQKEVSYKLVADDSPLDIIQVSDVVICSGSMAVETLLIKKPLVLLHSPDPNFVTVDTAPFYIAHSPEEIRCALEKIFCCHNDFSIEKINKFLFDVNFACDGGATERVCSLAMEMIHGTAPISFPNQDNRWLKTPANDNSRSIEPVSIVIATDNSREVIGSCLNHVIRSLRNGDEIIVVDNASSDDTVFQVAEMQRRSDQIQLLVHNRNMGYAAAINAGIQIASNNILVFLNPDTIVTHHWLERLTFHLGSSETYAVGPVFNNISGVQNVVFHLSPQIGNFPDLDIFAQQLFEQNHGRSVPAKLLSNKCIMIRKNAIKNSFHGDRHGGLSQWLQQLGFCLLVAVDTFIGHRTSVRQ